MADTLSKLTLTVSIEGERVCAVRNSSLPTVITVPVNQELRHLLVAGEPEIPFVGL